MKRYFVILYFCFGLFHMPQLAARPIAPVLDCKRPDIPSPLTVYPLSYTQDYLVNAYYLFFKVFLSDEDKMYLEALREISFKNLSKSEELLERLTHISPNYIYAYVQLGYVYLWQQKLDKAKETFDVLVHFCPCNEFSFEGMYELALACEKYEDKQSQAVELYRALHSCHPNSYVYLAGLGRTLARTHQWEEAEKILQECMQISPSDSDVGVQLANLYYWQGKYDQAEALFKKYQDRSDAREGLAKIAMARGNLAEAQSLYETVIAAQADNRAALQSLARVYAAQLKFKKARDTYKQLLEKYPDSHSGWAELFDVELHTDPVLNYNLNYYQAKEDDPSLKQPVVRDYYFDTSATLYIPVRDQWRIDIRTYYDFQKERNILPTNPGINYNVGISGGTFYSHALFWTYWKWDLFVNVKSAWGVGKNVYPFKNTTRIEPGSYLSYQSERQSLVLGGNVSSLIIKDFAKVNSQLLTVKSLDATYRYTIPVRCRPELEGWFEESFFAAVPSSNRRDSESGTFRFFVPFLEDYVRLFYTFEHRHFHKLNVNYYSFLQQWRNTCGLSLFLKSEKRRVSFDVTYWHRWQKTEDLFQPIGDFVFITPLQRLTCNQIEGAFRFRLKDHFRAEFLGGYYRDTLPYRIWNVRAHFAWVF